VFFLCALPPQGSLVQLAAPYYIKIIILTFIASFSHPKSFDPFFCTFTSPNQMRALFPFFALTFVSRKLKTFTT